VSPFEAFEKFIAMAIAAAAILALVLRGLNRLLVWMDEKDWILIPNQEAMKNTERGVLQGFLELQAIIEPAKRHVIQQKEDEEIETEQDDQGDGKD